MEIKTFGKISEIVNSEIELLFPMNLAQLKIKFEEQFPALKNIIYTVAINNEIISDESYIIIQPQSIALMPPFSGG